VKIEIGKAFPQYYKPSYPEEFELFSHFETTAGIPMQIFKEKNAFVSIFFPSGIMICTGL